MERGLRHVARVHDALIRVGVRVGQTDEMDMGQVDALIRRCKVAGVPYSVEGGHFCVAGVPVGTPCVAAVEEAPVEEPKPQRRGRKGA